MKRLSLLILAGLFLYCATAVGQDSKPAAKDESAKEYSTVLPNPAFEKVKSLAGQWVGGTERAPIKMSFKVMSAGSSVLLIMDSDKPGDEMVTVFHPDGERLLVTHYCSAKNQPRMRLEPGGDPNVLRFMFLDATNLPDPKIGHMVGLTLRLKDSNHHLQEWTFRENGKEQTEVFELHRKL